MDSVTIRWKSTNYNGLINCDDCFLYAVTFKKELRYIGMAYSQSAHARLMHKDHIRKKYQYLMDGITVWLGYIHYQSFPNISHKRIHDIESLLIYMNQPEDNTQSKKNYTGRPNLIVRSKYFPHLLPSIWAQDGFCYPVYARP